MPTHDDPSALWGAVMTAAGAFVALLVAFGVPLTETQTEALLAFGMALTPLLTALLIRRRAWKPSSVVEAAHEAARYGGLPEEVAKLPEARDESRDGELDHGP